MENTLPQNVGMAPPSSKAIVDATNSTADSFKAYLNNLGNSSTAPAQPTPTQTVIPQQQAPQQLAAPQQPSPVAQGTTPSPSVPEGLDPNAYILTKAIALQENGGQTPNYTQPSSDDHSSPDGSTGQVGGGAYQFTAPTWKAYAQKYLGDANAPMTTENQNQVAYTFVKSQLDAGMKPAQVASMWNAGPGEPNAYTGQFSNGRASTTGNYDVKGYATNVQKYAEQLWNQSQAAPEAAPTPDAVAQDNSLPTYGATFPASQQDNGLVAGFKALGNLPSSIYGVGSGLVNMALHPIDTVANIGKGVIGGVENLTGQNAGAPDQNQQVANAIGNALMQRYGGLDKLSNTATNDPFGFGTDVASIFAGGAGLVGKGAEAGDLASRAAQVVTSPIAGATTKVTGAIKGVLAGGESAGVSEAAARVGADLPVGSLTSNPIVRMTEAVSQTGLGAPKYAEIVDKAVATVDDYAKKLITEANSSSDLTKIGETIAKGVKDYTKTFTSAYEKAWTPIEKTIGSEAPVTTDATVNTLKNIIADYQSRGLAADAKFFQTKLDAVLGKTGGGSLTVSRLKSIRSDVDSVINYDKIQRAASGVTADQRDLLQLRTAMEGDLKTSIGTLGGQPMLAKYNEIQASFAKGMSEIGNTYIKSIRRFAGQGEYSKIADILASPSMPVEDIPRVLAVIGQEGADGLRSSIIQKILSGTATNAEGEFTAGGVLRQLKKFDEDRLALVLKPEQIQGLKDIGTINKALGDATKIAKGSQTAFILKIMAQAGTVGAGAWSLATGDILGAVQRIGAALGVEGASYFIASPTGQRLLKLTFTHAKDLSTEGAKLGLTPAAKTDTVTSNETTGGTNTSSGSGDGSVPISGGDISGPIDTVALEATAKEHGFDLQAARDSGYSDKEIQDFLKAASGDTKDVLKAQEAPPKEQGAATPNSAPRKITLDTNLTGEDAKIQQASKNKYEANHSELRDEYLSKNGNVVNTDNARKLFSDVGYNGVNSAAVHEAASAVANDAVDYLIKKNKDTGKDAYFLAGGSGAGKTTATIALKSKLDSAAFVLDGNLSNYESAAAKIAKAEKAGIHVTIPYVFKDPVLAWNQGVIERMLGDGESAGRVVPLKTFLENTTGALETVKKLRTDGIPTVQWDNSFGRGQAKDMTAEELKSIRIPANLQSKLTSDTESLARTGKISQEQYESLLNGLPHSPFKDLQNKGK